jgi:hypothetical protein
MTLRLAGFAALFEHLGLVGDELDAFGQVHHYDPGVAVGSGELVTSGTVVMTTAVGS